MSFYDDPREWAMGRDHPEADPNDEHPDPWQIRRDSISVCPACGDPIDSCQGHGEIGDPAGWTILRQHDAEDHSSCNPRGCEEANQA